MPEWVAISSSAGGSGVGSGWTSETPIGALNGTNTVFTISYAPIVLLLFLNGVMQVQGVNFTISGTTITFTKPPKARDANYLVAIYPHN